MIFNVRAKRATVPIISFSVMLFGCGDSGGSSSSQPGIAVEISAQMQPSPNADNSVTAQPAGRKLFLNSEGVQIELTHAYVVVGSVTLESDCDGSAFASIDWTMAPRAFVDWLIPSVQAHTTATPTQTGEPHVLNILAADLQVAAIGDLAPPAGSYCGISADIASADGDAIGLPADINMVGKTLFIEGTYGLNGAAVSFTLQTSIALLPASMKFPEPLALNAEHRNGRVTLQLSYQRWFDGVDLESISTDVQRDIVLTNIRDSLSAHIN